MIASLLAAVMFQKPIRGASDLVYGDQCAFWVQPPKGWVMDNNAGKVDGAPVVFYAQGSSWITATAAMYARSTPKDGLKLAAFIEADRHRFATNDPQLKSYAREVMKTGDHRNATVVRYDSTKGQYELVAFVDLPKAFALLVLTARKPEGLTENRPAFNALVSSFAYFGDKVKIDKTP